MKIGIAGPMSLNLIRFDPENKLIPVGYPFPATSMLINGFLNNGHEVVAYTTSVGIKEPLIFENEKIKIHILPRREKHVARDFFKFERRFITDAILRSDVDIIHAQWSYEFASAALESNIPTMVAVHDHAWNVFMLQSNPYRFVRWIMNHINLTKTSYISVPSNFLFSILPKSYQRKTVVLPFFIPNTFFLENTSQLNSRSIVSVCNGFGRLKNIATALKAFSILRKKKPDVEYRLIGQDMEEGGPAHQFAKSQKLDQGVRFVGSLSFHAVIDEVKRSFLFLHPSRTESFGMAVLEAMALGKIIIGGNNSGNVPYFLENGKYGILCDIDSPQSIAEALMASFENEDFFLKLGKAASKYVFENFNEDKVIGTYIKHYTAILS